MPELVARRSFLKLSGFTSAVIVAASRPAHAGPTKKLSGRSATTTTSTGSFAATDLWPTVWPTVWPG